MAELGYTADYDALEQPFEIVPVGEYLSIIEGSEYTPNNKGTGMILKLTYQIIEGEKKGSKIFENLNLQNESKRAEQIAQRALNSICMAVGVQHVQDSSQLHNIPLILDVIVKTEKDKDGNDKDQNVIRKHIPANAQKSSGGFQQQTQQPSGVQGSENKAQPWAVKK